MLRQDTPRPAIPRRQLQRKRYALVMSPDNTWMIFNVATGSPVTIGSVPLIGLKRELGSAVLRILNDSDVDY